MPNRILREGILTSPNVAKLGWAEEVFYRRLMSVVDDFGRYFGDPGMLRAACFPRQLNKVSDSDVGKWLHGVAVAGLVRVYPALDGENYIELAKFGQQVRAKKSKFPNPIANDSNCQQEQTNAHLDVSVSVSEDVDDKPARAPFAIPDWINKTHWDAWHSGAKRRKATDAQKQMAVDKLAAWRNQGQDYAGALENAAVGGWQGLFLPDKGKPSPGITVPSKPGRDPELERLENDAKRAVGPSLAVLERMAKLKQGLAA